MHNAAVRQTHNHGRYNTVGQFEVFEILAIALVRPWPPSRISVNTMI